MDIEYAVWMIAQVRFRSFADFAVAKRTLRTDHSSARGVLRFRTSFSQLAVFYLSYTLCGFSVGIVNDRWCSLFVHSFLLQLVVSPKTAYRHVSYHKQTRDQWSRDDPAFTGALVIAGYASPRAMLYDVSTSQMPSVPQLPSALSCSTLPSPVLSSNRAPSPLQ